LHPNQIIGSNMFHVTTLYLYFVCISLQDFTFIFWTDTKMVPLFSPPMELLTRQCGYMSTSPPPPQGIKKFDSSFLKLWPCLLMCCFHIAFWKIINAHMMWNFIIINIKLDRFPLPYGCRIIISKAINYYSNWTIMSIIFCFIWPPWPWLKVRPCPASLPSFAFGHYNFTTSTSIVALGLICVQFEMWVIIMIHVVTLFPTIIPLQLNKWDLIFPLVLLGLIIFGMGPSTRPTLSLYF
jgi:hypothetical protein